LTNCRFALNLIAITQRHQPATANLKPAEDLLWAIWSLAVSLSLFLNGRTKSWFFFFFVNSPSPISYTELYFVNNLSYRLLSILSLHFWWSSYYLVPECILLFLYSRDDRNDFPNRDSLLY
jgi:hypothetical protein